MQVAEQLDIERLRKQSEFLLRIYRAEIAQDPASRATQSSRSHVIAMQHTVRQMYGEAVARDVASFVTLQNRSSRFGTNDHLFAHQRPDASQFRTSAIEATDIIANDVTEENLNGENSG
jgi:hypothetical protein